MSFEAPINKAVAREMSYDLKPSSSGQKSRINIAPYNSPSVTLNSTQLVQFYIPRRPNTFLDGQSVYLTGIVSLPAQTNAARINRNCQSLINRLSVYGSNSLLLEDIANYNLLAHTITDMSLNFYDKLSLSLALGGYSDSLDTSTGDAVTDDGDGLAAAGSFTINFAIPLISSFFSLSEKLFPIGALSDDLRLDIYLETAQRAFSQNGAADISTGYSFQNLELVCDVITMDQPILPMGQPIYIHSTSWRNYVSNFPNGSSSLQSVLIPHRSLSVKQLLFFSNRGTTQGIDAMNRVSPWGTSNLNVSFNIGGQRTPSKPISTFAEMNAETQKSFHSWSEVVMNGSYNKNQYIVQNTTAPTYANRGNQKHVFGYDFDTYSKKSGVILSGSNWSTINSYIEGNVSNDTATSALSTALTNYCYVHYDVIYIIKDGMIDVRY